MWSLELSTRNIPSFMIGIWVVGHLVTTLADLDTPPHTPHVLSPCPVPILCQSHVGRTQKSLLWEPSRATRALFDIYHLTSCRNYSLSVLKEWVLMSTPLINPTLENLNGIIPHLWTHLFVQVLFCVVHISFQEVPSSNEVLRFNNLNRIIRSIDRFLSPTNVLLYPARRSYGL